MKKLIRVFVVLLMCLVLFYGCDEKVSLETVSLPDGDEYIKSQKFSPYYLDSEGRLWSWGASVTKEDTGTQAFFSPICHGENVAYDNVPSVIAENIAFFSNFGCRGITKNGERFILSPDTDKLEILESKGKVVKSLYSSYLTDDGSLWVTDYNGVYEDTCLMTEVADFYVPNSLSLKKDGTLWIVRYNAALQPLEHEKIDSDVIELCDPDSSMNTTLYIKSDNSLWAFGNNEYGQCGNGEHGDFDYSTMDYITQPYKIADNVEYAVSTGFITSYITLDGKLYACGANRFDSMNKGDPILSVYQMKNSGNVYLYDTPVLVMENVREYQLGFSSYAILNDNSLWTWGIDDFGTCGNGAYGEGFPTDFEGDGEQLAGLLNSEEDGAQFSYSAPQKIADDVKRFVGYAGGLRVFESNDGSMFCFGYDSIIVNEEDNWDLAFEMRKYNESYDAVIYVEYKVVPTPQPFDVTTFHSDLTRNRIQYRQ